MARGECVEWEPIHRGVWVLLLSPTVVKKNKSIERTMPLECREGEGDYVVNASKTWNDVGRAD